MRHVNLPRIPCLLVDIESISIYNRRKGTDRLCLKGPGNWKLCLMFYRIEHNRKNRARRGEPFERTRRQKHILFYLSLNLITIY